MLLSSGVRVAATTTTTNALLIRYIRTIVLLVATVVEYLVRYLYTSPLVIVVATGPTTTGIRQY
jgi:hypothetical protein